MIVDKIGLTKGGKIWSKFGLSVIMIFILRPLRNHRYWKQDYQSTRELLC